MESKRSVSLLLIVFVTTSAVARTTSTITTSHTVALVNEICSQSPYPNLSISSPEPSPSFDIGYLQSSITEFSNLPLLADGLISANGDERVRSALRDCKYLLEDAVDRLNDSISTYSNSRGIPNVKDTWTWVSTAVTDQETCLGGVEELLNYTSSAALVLKDLTTLMKRSTVLASNSLAVLNFTYGSSVNWWLKFSRSIKRIGIERRAGWADPDPELTRTVWKFPDRVRREDARLLKDSVHPTPHLTVAKDGSGNYKTIGEAVGAVPNKSESRFVIYVKEGKYVENVIVHKHKWNVMIYGDGMNKTIVSGGLNFVDGSSTFSSATFAAEGKGFIARDMGFENTAGPTKLQAVAFRSGSDGSIFYRCSFHGFQGTLYAHSNRQYYRNCEITGTINFIFGNAAAAFQRCDIKPRQPRPNQINTITAQARTDPNQNTGFIIAHCNIFPLDNVTVSTYLGTPLKDYSTTIIKISQIASFLNPLGWKERVDNVVPPNTIFYVEHQNTGPGSSLDQRVKWVGYVGKSRSQLQMQTGDDHKMVEACIHCP